MVIIPRVPWSRHDRVWLLFGNPAHHLRRPNGSRSGALDAAIELGIPHGGWCPKGRLSENGKIDRKYQLQELPTADYAARTERNVIDSDGTLILYRQRLQEGPR